MSKEIELQELPKKINEIIAALDAGESVTIVHEGKPFTKVAVMPPHEGVEYPFRDLEITPLEKPLTIDAVEVLVAEREYERSCCGWC